MEVVKLRPYIKQIVWGGNTLREYGKVSEGKNIAECWELSLHEEGSFSERSNKRRYGS